MLRLFSYTSRLLSNDVANNTVFALKRKREYEAPCVAVGIPTGRGYLQLEGNVPAEILMCYSTSASPDGLFDTGNGRLEFRELRTTKLLQPIEKRVKNV